ncbi:Similar to DnaJ homolog dnj-20; acc. no. Q626I7 [Pyronema omphalodes CBS 100304]|uniref:Similar to DnaJ homolog dnj-20 acc. no. Q626I7 n=1 Tax=Pyronema omphalodes (strain CBS 100304) TaxID=1076935 RepID=U4LBG7_PYROM|nr:Similar to DnaJ homolog dnj-20; acc. no. Q626I7 [Pyronema omphalodes CBS 100304]
MTTTPPEDPLVHKARLIEEILSASDLYVVLGASTTATSSELRRHYLERSKTVHPDRYPPHSLSTPAFQRLSHAYEILHKPELRNHYDRESRMPPPRRVGTETTFRSAVLSILHEFLHGDFQLVRNLLAALGRQYPSLVNEEVVTSLERSFAKMRELVLTTQTYALLLSIELGRLYRVQKRMRQLGYFDVVGRMRIGMQLVRVTLAIPVRVDRALRMQEEREFEARQAGRQSIGRSRLLNERVSKVLEFLVGSEVEDMPEDGRWNTWANTQPVA